MATRGQLSVTEPTGFERCAAPALFHGPFLVGINRTNFWGDLTVESAVIQLARGSNRCGVFIFRIAYRGADNHLTTFSRIAGWLPVLLC